MAFSPTLGRHRPHCSVLKCKRPHLGKGLCSKHYQRLTTKTSRIMGTPEERFWIKVVKTKNCWIWQGQPGSWGYGNHFIKKGHSMLAHRYAWKLTHGSIPTDLLVCHKCDNPICVRPNHLFLGTHADNMADMKTKGRGRTGQIGEKHHLAKLSYIKADEIKRFYNLGANMTDLARGYGVTNGCIWFVIQGRSWAKKEL